jgi:hypothetical protein
MNYPVWYEESAMKLGSRGLDNRHRDANGEISRKHSNTQIRSLRRTYGPDFAEGRRADMTLRSLLGQTGESSLSQYLKNRSKAHR